MSYRGSWITNYCYDDAATARFREWIARPDTQRGFFDNLIVDGGAILGGRIRSKDPENDAFLGQMGEAAKFVDSDAVQVTMICEDGPTYRFNLKPDPDAHFYGLKVEKCVLGPAFTTP